MSTLPIPPLEMRALVGPTAEVEFDNPTGALVFGDLPADATASVFDLGCGCGRIARKLIQQQPRPDSYIGVDLHAGMINWCQTNLGRVDPNFHFIHHDVYELGFNPTGRSLDQSLPLPAPDDFASLIVAWSVFTHLLEDDIPYYLRECARVLRPGGVIRSTWFLFDKRYFPMMQDFQNTLYVNSVNPTNAVIVDRNWLLARLVEAGLTVANAQPPALRGYQWIVDLRAAEVGVLPVLPATDDAPFGSLPPPIGSVDAYNIGLTSSRTG